MNDDERFSTLWTDYLEGDLDAAGLSELQTMLDADPALQSRATDLFQVHRLLGFMHQDSLSSSDAFIAAALRRLPVADDEFVDGVMNHLPPAVPSRRPLLPRMLIGMACGLLIGVLATSAAWVYAVPRGQRVTGETVILAESFEAGPAPLVAGMASETGVWSGDFTDVTGEQNGVRPADGRKMLRFLRADYRNKPTPDRSYVADLYYLLDVRQHRHLFDDGGGVLQVSAGFNAALFPEHEKYQCSISLYALDGESAANVGNALEYPLQNDALAYVRAHRLFMDRDPGTWQRLAGEMRLPANAEFVLVRIGLIHATAAQRRTDFPAHYLDDVKVLITRRSPLP